MCAAALLEVETSGSGTAEAAAVAGIQAVVRSALADDRLGCYSSVAAAEAAEKEQATHKCPSS